MKRKNITLLLTIVGALGCICALAVHNHPDYFGDSPFPLNLMGNFFLTVSDGGSFGSALTSIMAFPFDQIGSALSKLSSLGTVGNGLALALLAIISTLPLALVLRDFKAPDKRKENFVLVLLCPLLFFVLFTISNTEMLMSFHAVVSAETANIVKAVLGCCAWSGIVTYFILKMLRLFYSSDNEKLMKYIKALSYFLSAFFVICLTFVSFPQLLTSIDSAVTHGDTFKAYLGFFIDAVTYIMDILVTLCAAELIDTILSGADSVAIKAKANILSNRSVTALSVITILGFIFNLVQVFRHTELTNINTTINLPITSIIFVIAMILFSRLVTENKQLKEDNDLFV